MSLENFLGLKSFHGVWSLVSFSYNSKVQTPSCRATEAESYQVYHHFCSLGPRLLFCANVCPTDLLILCLEEAVTPHGAYTARI